MAHLALSRLQAILRRFRSHTGTRCRAWRYGSLTRLIRQEPDEDLVCQVPTPVSEADTPVGALDQPLGGRLRECVAKRILGRYPEPSAEVFKMQALVEA